MTTTLTTALQILLLIGIGSDQSQDRAPTADSLRTGLVAHWPLAGDLKDHSGNGLDAEARGAIDPRAAGRDGKPGGAVGLDGGGELVVRADPKLDLGDSDLTLSAWVNTEEDLDSPIGDILSRYDSKARRGWIFGVKTSAGVTFNQANFRQPQFGIDDDHQTDWESVGRPGGDGTLLAFGLVEHDGQLYAGVCRPGAGDSGRVYRYAGGTEWVDCGAPDQSNAVTAMAVFQGKLYVGTGRYRVAGSSLPESPNDAPGGRVFRYEGGTTWTDCGQLPESVAVGGLALFQGKLHAGSLYAPAGFYRYEGDGEWKTLETPGARVEALAAFDGKLYASTYDKGHVYRFDGETWEDLGPVGDPEINTQTYSFIVYEGDLHVGTWRSGRVYRLTKDGKWEDRGQLGDELEVMGMLVHNGRFIAGSLPLANVYHHEGGQNWRPLKQLDATPDVVYRRAWTMAEHNGRLFVSTLPSGEVHSYRAGASATGGNALPGGWRHVAAVRSGDALRVFVDGREVASNTVADSGAFNLSTDAPLLIGSGPNAPFRGRISDVRIHNRALDDEEIHALAAP